MDDNLEDIFLKKHYNYIIENLTRDINLNNYILNINWSFFTNNKNFYSSAISQSESLNLIGSGEYGVGSILYLYKKFGIINEFNKCKIKNKHQKEYYNKFKDANHWGVLIDTSFFNYEIKLNYDKLILFGDILYNKNTKFNYSRKFLNELTNLINSLGINHQEIIDIYNLDKDDKYLFYNVYLNVFGISFDKSLFIELLKFISKICKLKNLYGSEFNNLLEFEGIKLDDNEEKGVLNSNNIEIIKTNKGLKLVGNEIKNNNGDTVYLLKKIEKDIIKSIYDNTEKGGISTSNIIKITNQTKKAFNQYLKTFRKDLKNKGLNNIEIKYDRSENTYKCYMS